MQNVPSPWQHRIFCTLSTYPYSYLYRTSYAIASLILAHVGIYLYIHKATFSFAGNNGPLYCCVFSSIYLSLCLKLTVWNVVDVLAQSSISHSHCGQLSPSCNEAIILICLLLFLFLCFLAPWLLPSRHYCFSSLHHCAILRFSSLFFYSCRHFFAMPFSSLPSIISLFS